MNCCYPIQDNSWISDWGPFLASLITGIIVYISARYQGDSTLSAAKAQSEATILTMQKTIESQIHLKKRESLQLALMELLMNLYLIERRSDSYFKDEKTTLNSLAKLLTTLGNSTIDSKIRDLLNELRIDLINKGDMTRVPEFRSKIESILPELLE